MGFDAPAPILSQYDFPHPMGQPPFHVQLMTSAMMTMNPKSYVLNGMGTGKTRSALWSWDYLNKKGLAKKLLVVAPLSTLNFVWMREVFATLPHRVAVVLHGTRAQRLAKLQDPSAEILIINHDGLKVIREDIEKDKDINSLIIDELAVYRRGSSQRSKDMRKFVQNMLYVWGMTGSPIPTSPTDVWAQAKIVTPHTVPNYFRHFEEQLMYKVGPFKLLPKDDAPDKAFAVMQPAVRYALDDVVELPDMISRTLDVELGPKQEKVYNQIKSASYTMFKNHQITAVNAGAVMNKLLQISLGWVYDSNGAAVTLDGNKRIEALLDTLEAAQRKVLVFVPYTHALSGVSHALTVEGIEHAVVSGATPARVRGEVFNLFQNTDKYRVLVAHPQCLAHGITLTAADTIIWFGPVTSLEIYDQANHRIRRVGQKHKQLVLHLQSTPVEKRIYQLLQKKQDVQAYFLKLFEELNQ